MPDLTHTAAAQPLSTTSIMVDIYLIIENKQIHTLSIPLSDIKRLSLRPLKWLRFVTFTVCGVQGDLSETPNGHHVNYSTSYSAIAPDYYYTPQGETRTSQICPHC